MPGPSLGKPSPPMQGSRSRQGSEGWAQCLRMTPDHSTPGAIESTRGGERAHRWRSVIWLTLIGLAAWMVWSMHQPSRSHAAVGFDRIQFMPLLPDASGPAPSARPMDVSLPDNWRARGLSSTGAGRYEARFNLQHATPRQMALPWALQVDHLCSQHAVSLNGRLLSTTEPTRHSPGRMAPELIDIPSEALHPGGNVLSVDISCLQQGGLSPLVLAPKTDLRTPYMRARFYLISLPLSLNIAGLAFSIFLLMLWWLRGENANIGMLGSMTMLISLSNSAYYAGQHMTLPLQLLQWVHFMAYTITCTVSGLFVLTHTHQHMPAFRRLLWCSLIGLSALGLMAFPLEIPLQKVRIWSDTYVLSLAMVTIWVLLRHNRRQGERPKLPFAAISAPLILSALHDILFIRVLGDPTAPFLAPLGLPFAIPSIYLAIAERAAGVIRELEASNQHLEARVQSRTAELVSANAAKGDFLAAASHDLRQPMVAIGLIAGMLKDKLKGSELEGMTGRLSEAVESMDNLLSRLLDLSRLESGAFELSPQRVPLQPLFDAIVAHESVAARARGLSIRMRPTTACVWSDPVLLEQILRNLISNALRYTESGGVLVGARRRGSQWLIQVWDTGIGIPPEHQQRIFDDFVQLGNPGRNAQAGLGLGLALVKRATNMLGAQVVVHSQLGEGSRFELCLPMAASPTRPLTTPFSVMDAAPPPATSEPLKGRHILVLEDDRAVRHALEKRLHAWGARVTCLSCMREAVLWLQDGTRPDLLLADQRLGDGTGLEAMALMREHWPELPTVIVTGDTAPSQLQSLYGCGAPILHKPFKIDDLRETLQHACQGGSQTEARVLQSAP